MRSTLLFLSILLLTSSSAEPADVPTRRPNVLLIVLDTLRYDATSFGDPASNNTPFLASLGKNGVVFQNAYATHDFTPPSHYSMLTGIREGLGTEHDRAEYGVPHQLRLIGYDTFGISANELLAPSSIPALKGLSRFRGVTDIDNGTIPFTKIADVDLRLRLFGCRKTNYSRAMVYYDAERILAEVLAQIRSAKPPYFGFVNLIDVHEPYVPDLTSYKPEPSLPPDFDGDVMKRKLGPELAKPDSMADPARRAYVKRKIAEVRFPKLVAVDLSAAARAVYRQRYIAEVRSLDAVLRQFFKELQKEKLLSNTIVVITSDHGEAFGEDDLITHMFRDSGAIEATHHVPLLLVLPPEIAATEHLIDRRVSLAAIPATIYDLTGIDSSELRARFKDSPRSLVPLFATTSPPAHKFALPPLTGEVDAEAKRELERRLRSLGYIQ